MPYSMAVLEVEDYARWKANYNSEGSRAARKAAGETSYQIFRVADDPKTFVLLNEWDDEQKVRQFLSSPKLREMQQESGVLGTPQLYVFGEREEGTP